MKGREDALYKVEGFLNASIVYNMTVISDEPLVLICNNVSSCYILD